MADNTETEKMPRKLPAVTAAEKADAQAALAEAGDAEIAAPDTDIEDDGLDELPEGAVLAGSPDNSVDARIAHATGDGAMPPVLVADFTDEHVGMGGSYVVTDDGVRRPAYEQYQTPAPGKRGERGEMVTKYRRLV